MENIEKRLEILEVKMDNIYTSVEKTRRYMLWTGIITIAVIVLPLIGLMFALPSFMNNYIDNIQGLGL